MNGLNYLRKIYAGVLGGLLAGMLLIGAGTIDLHAQGPFSAQIQAALRVFLAAPHTWTGVQTHTGQVGLPDGSVSAPGIGFASEATGFYHSNGNRIALAVFGQGPVDMWIGARQQMRSDGVYAWVNATNAETGTVDTGISRGSAAVVNVGNGTAGDGSGTISAAAAIFGSNVAMGTTGRIFWSTRAQILSPSDGAFVVENNAATIGSQVKADALPTVSACGAGSPAVTAGSTPWYGSVTIGTTSVATCTITFNGTAYPSAPHCSGAVETTTAANTRTMGYSATTTVLTIVPSAAWADSSVVNWNCGSAK